MTTIQVDLYPVLASIVRSVIMQTALVTVTSDASLNTCDNGYHFNIYKSFGRQETKSVLDETENLYQWLLSKLP